KRLHRPPRPRMLDHAEEGRKSRPVLLADGVGHLGVCATLPSAVESPTGASAFVPDASMIPPAPFGQNRCTSYPEGTTRRRLTVSIASPPIIGTGTPCALFEDFNMAGCLLNATGDATCVHAWLAAQQCAEASCSDCVCTTIEGSGVVVSEECIEDGGNTT